MKRYTGFQKLMSMILSLVLIMGMIPTYAAAAQTRSVPVDSRVSDPNTMNQWQDYFGPQMLSTEFAGGVWTDKSVLTSASDFRADITMNDPDNHFLVALSALAANQQIVGYASAPIDVMLVLDVSGSMQGSKATAMVQATNETIDSLLKQNNNNRVGVVLYSGNSSTNQNAGSNTATVILPLDRYTTNSTQTVGTGRDAKTIPAYFTISNNTVSVASTVRNSSGQVSGSKAVSGGTYIQNGLYKAWGEFSKVTDVKVPAGQAQAGAQRTPILVLMSDGQPTLATAAYNNVGTSERTYGDGQEKNTNWQTVFLTQLTASWVKSKMQTKYGTTPKFYTLGLGTGSSNYATAVLQPSTSYETLDGYWDNFFDSSKLDNNNNVEIIPNTNNWWENSNAWSVYKDSAVKAQDYSDMYKLASDTDELIKAFQQVVENIELDAAGYVTLVEAAGEDYSGYITFTDELGMFMEVKDVKGLVLGDILFTGHELAKSLQESSMGTQQNPTDYGNEFIATVRERLGIADVSTAQNLVIAAYNDGQLAYDAQTEAYSNYIGWYSDNDGTYLGFWDKDTGITAEGAPAGATWINKSYGYLGAAGSSDMMHVVVMISTHIESGMQVVQYKIPASLIPMVTYEIELNGSDPTDMKSIDCTNKNPSPLRLVYEVGLIDEVNSVNVEQKLDEAIEAGWGHAHKESDGSYAFYTNLWGAEHGDSTVDYNDPLNHRVAQSHFHPAEGNDRYYYTVDTPVYVKSGDSYTLYTGTAAPSGSGYYRAHHYYTSSGYTTEYLPMSAYALNQAASMGRQEDGCWYIPQGSVFQQIDRFKMLKEQNLTGTLEYFDYPVVVDVGDKYDTYAFLGNNGKITLKPAQGIQLTKTVTETVEGAQDSFTFDITLSQAVAEPLVTDADGQPVTGWSVDGNVITVTLQAGQTVCITGIPAGVTYTVTERDHADYIGSSDNATGMVKVGTISAVDFVNIPKGYGNLIISKDVDHPFTTVPAVLTEKEFTIHVNLAGDDVANAQFAIAGTDPVEYITTDENGSFTVTLKDNGSMTLVGLPEGTTFTTTETLDPVNHAGFTMDADRSVLTGTIVKDTAVQTHVVNVYKPAAPETVIHVAGTKTLTDEAGAFDWEGKSFTVRLEQYDPATGTYTNLGEKQVTEGNLSYLFADHIKLNSLGDYYFKVSEVIPTERLEGMSYDATVGRFRVRVTDEDVDGQMELAVYDVDTQTDINAANGVVTYTKDFENIHTTDATYVEFTVDKNLVDPHNTGVTEAGFLFELYEIVDGVTATTPAYAIRTVMVDDQGQATFHIPITKTGTWQYVLKESIPDDAAKIPGMVYDNSQFLVEVTATAQDGKLVPSVTITKDGQQVALEDVAFENVIDLEPVVLQPKVNKELVGREPLNDSEFTFQIVQTDGSFATAIENGYSDTISVGKGEKSFKEITVTHVGTYYFRVTEVAGTTSGVTYDNAIYHITANVSVQNDALVKDVTYVKVGEGVASTQTDYVLFTNTYANNDTEEVTLSGSKSLTGRSLITGEFSFQLKEGEEVLQTVTNRADGSFVFEPITYTAADVGDHVYTVVEVNDGKGGVSYDKTVYTVTVTVADNGLGELVVSTSGADNITFNNSYYAKPVTVSFGGTKTWYNTDLQKNQTLTGGEFAFVLYATDANYSYQGAQVARVTNAAGGSFTMGLTYQTAGHYYYLLREEVGSNAAVGYDGAVYRVHIVVYDNGAGSLIGSVSEIYQEGTDHSSVSFTNTYTPAPTQLSIEGIKELTGRNLADGEFSFQLRGEDGAVIETVANANGKFIFSPISYTHSGTYTYQVQEVIPQQAEEGVYQGVTYDATVFDVTVTVTDNNGTLEASYTASVDGTDEELKFVNEYGIENFTDFDLSGNKLLRRGNDVVGFYGRTFRFAILDSNGVVLQTVTADNSGSFRFENVPLTATGTHTFTVKELNDGLDGIVYDETVFTVTVDVADDGLGDLHAANPVVTLNGESVDLTFNNGYTLEPIQEVLQAEKELEGKTLQADMFSFQLYQTEEDFAISGEPLQTVKNNATGEIIFEAMEYTDPGTYYYAIQEVIPQGTVNGITYDEHVIHVTVYVEDNNDGTLSSSVTYHSNPVFTNTYTVVGDPQVDISGTKTLTGKELADGDFTFVLTDAQGNTTEVSNVGNGFTFEDVKLSGLGEHTFTVSEKDTGKGGIVYDGKVYDVSVTVTDDGLGGMIVGIPVVTYHGVATELHFVNKYEAAPVQHPLTATKTYNKDMTGGEFHFTLTGQGVSQNKTNDANGVVTFDNLVFTEAGEYTYTVKEVRGDKTYITYDGTEYTVYIKVTDDGEGKLTVESATVNGDPEGSLVFENTYKPAYTQVAIEGTKELVGGGLKENDFRFDLYMTDDTYSIDGLQPVGTQTNDGNGQFRFRGATVSQLNFTKEGTFYYVLVENAENPMDGIRYDTTAYRFKVTVTDNQEGQLVAKLDCLDADAQSIRFNNAPYEDVVSKDVTYPGSTASIDGKKVYAGEILEYTIRYTNYTTQKVDVTITDTIPQHTGYVDGSASHNGTYANGQVAWNLEVAAGETAAITFQVKVNEDVQAVNIPNKATVIDGTNTYETNEVTNYTVVDEVSKDVFYPEADTVSIDGKKVYAGETLLYKVSYTNTDSEKVTVTITDAIPAHTAYVDGSASHNGSYADGVITWQAQVAAGQTLTVSFQVKVDENAKAVTIPNQATVLEGKNTYQTNEVTNYTVVDEVEKDVFNADAPTVSIDGRKVYAGETLIYRISYTNTATEEAAVTITDTIPAHTGFVSADNGGQFAGGKITWNVKVAAGQTLVVSFQVKVDADVQNETIPNKATVKEGKNSYETNEVTNFTVVDEVSKDVFYPEADTVSINGQKVYAGENLLYKVSYKNTSSEEVTVTITDKIPAYTAYVAGSASHNGTYADGVITWNAKVAAGQTLTVSFQVKVDEEVQAVTIPNKATVKEGKNTYETNEVTNYTVVDQVEKDVFNAAAPAVSIDGKKVYAGDTLIYQISYTNTASQKADVTITDKLPQYTSFVSADNGGQLADGKLTWNLEVKAGQTVTVSFQVKVDENVQVVNIPNQATVLEGKNSYETNEVTNYTVVDEVEKDVFYPEAPTVSIDGQKVYAGETLLYKVSYKNTSTEQVTVTITDAIPAYTSFVSADNGGQFAEGVLTWSLDVEAGQTVTVSFQVKVDADVQAVTIPNTATVAEGRNTYETNEVTNYTVVDEVEKDVFLNEAPTVSVDGQKVNVGDTLTYTIRYTNTAAAAATVTITDTIPAYTSFVSADNGGQFADGVVTWTLNVPAGQTLTVSLTVIVVADAQDVVIANQAQILEGKNSYETNTVYIHTTEDPIVKDVFQANVPTVSIDGKKVEVGDTLLYTITYRNMASEAITLQITDAIPKHTSYVAGSADFDGVCADGVITWNLELAAWETKTVSFKVIVNQAGVTLHNQAQSFDGTNTLQTNIVTNHTIEDVTDKDVFQSGDLNVSIDGKPVKVGDTLSYTITYRNVTGEDVNVTITDKLPQYTSFVSADNGGIFADGVITWNVNVAAWQQVTVSFTVTVTAENQILTNTAQVLDGFNEYDTNTVVNHTVTEITEKDVFNAAAPSISIDGKQVKVGDTLLYTITYRNATVNAVALQITDAIPAHTTYLDGSADFGGVFADGVITWNLDVPAWNTVTVSFQVTVNDPDAVIPNKATLFDGTNTLDTNIVVNHTVDEPLEKDVFNTSAPTVSVDGKQVKVGDTLVYTITYHNLTDKAVQLELTDTIPAHTTYVTGSADMGGVFADGVITWNLELEAWQNVTVSFQVKVKDLSATITNKAQSFDGTNSYQSNVVTNTTPDPIPKTGDDTDLALLTGTACFSMLGILVMLYVLVMDRKKSKFER